MAQKSIWLDFTCPDILNSVAPLKARKLKTKIKAMLNTPTSVQETWEEMEKKKTT